MEVKQDPAAKVGCRMSASVLDGRLPHWHVQGSVVRTVTQIEVFFGSICAFPQVSRDITRSDKGPGQQETYDPHVRSPTYAYSVRTMHVRMGDPVQRSLLNRTQPNNRLTVAVAAAAVVAAVIQRAALRESAGVKRCRANFIPCRRRNFRVKPRRRARLLVASVRDGIFQLSDTGPSASRVLGR